MTSQTAPVQRGPTINGRPKVLFLVTEDWHFCSHRLALAKAIKDCGFDVLVATRVSKDGDRIRKAGLRLFPLRLRRESRAPWNEISAIRELTSLYSAERPDIVHHVAMKPVVYGSVAAKRANIPFVVNAIAGLGSTISSPSLVGHFSRPLMRRLLKFSLNGPNRWLVVQNPEDYSYFANGIVNDSGRILMIRGSGVDLSEFVPLPEPAGPPVIALPSRMLRDKGVEEFVKAASLLRDSGIQARFVLVGTSDPANPSSIPESQLERWQAEGAVECWGWRTDMPNVLRSVHVVCLPSYREGVPKILIEAAASARPIVASDVAGCHEVVRHGENGFLCPPRDAVRLADALRPFIQDRDLRIRMGRRGRQIAEAEFGIEKVIGSTVELYRRVLHDADIMVAASEVC